MNKEGIRMDPGKFAFDRKMLFLAPLAGYSDSPFRRVCKQAGADVVTTEMVNSIGLTRYPGDRKVERYIYHTPWERPIGIQLFGSDPISMTGAAIKGEELGFDFVDINMGCPVKKIMKTGAGAVLLKNPALAQRIVKNIKSSISIPLSVKIRTGWDESDSSYLQMAEALFSAGIDALTVHPRTVIQGMNGKADHDKTGEIKKIWGKKYIIANGGIMKPGDVSRVREQSGCDGIMIGRGALSNPNLFSETKGASGPGDSGTLSLKQTVLEHFDMMVSVYGERAAVLFRKNISWYSKNLHGSAPFRKRTNGIMDPGELRVEIEKFF